MVIGTAIVKETILKNNAVIKPENVQVTRTQTQASASTKTLKKEMRTIFPILSTSFGFQKTVDFNLLHYDFA